jgi:hypothetical protein
MKLIELILEWNNESALVHFGNLLVASSPLSFLKSLYRTQMEVFETSFVRLLIGGIDSSHEPAQSTNASDGLKLRTS